MCRWGKWDGDSYRHWAKIPGGCRRVGRSWSGSTSFRWWSHNTLTTLPPFMQSIVGSGNASTFGSPAIIRCWLKRLLARASINSPRLGGMGPKSTRRKMSISWSSKGSSGRRCSGSQRGRRAESCNQDMLKQSQGNLFWMCFVQKIRRHMPLQPRVLTPNPADLQNWSLSNWQRTQL